MPPKKITYPLYPRYFRSEDPDFQNCIICFPSAGSLGSAYYPELRRWALPQWTLKDMEDAPVDIEITEKCRNRMQAVAFGVPRELPAFKADTSEE